MTPGSAGTNISSLSSLRSRELWRQMGTMQMPCWTLCSFRRVRKGTETPLKWRWVRSCCHATPTTVESWVLDSCWSGWTPQPACLVGKCQKTMHFPTSRHGACDEIKINQHYPRISHHVHWGVAGSRECAVWIKSWLFNQVILWPIFENQALR